MVLDTLSTLPFISVEEESFEFTIDSTEWPFSSSTLYYQRISHLLCQKLQPPSHLSCRSLSCSPTLASIPEEQQNIW